MIIEHGVRDASNRKIALLIDADNISHARIAAILAELSKHGTANIRRAYGDWASTSLKGWKARLHEFAIRPIQQFSYSAGKNATDIALVIDAMELLYTQKLDAFCIASSDGDFTPLVMQLKANGHDVYGFGERKTPEPFVNACTTFLYIDSLDGTADVATPDPQETTPEPKPKGKARVKADAAVPVEPKGNALAQDAKLVEILRGAVEAAAGEDGWAAMATAGNYVSRQSSIDPRNYKVKNFAKLFEKTGLFDIAKATNGQTYVADMRTKDRAKHPERARPVALDASADDGLAVD